MEITTRKPYLTDLTEAEWSILEPFMPETKLLGRPREHSWREILKPSSILLEPAVPGVTYLTIFPNGKVSITISEYGA